MRLINQKYGVLLAIVLLTGLFGVTFPVFAYSPLAVEPVGLDSMTSTAFSRLPYFKSGTNAYMSSSHDLTGGNNDANNCLYNEENGDCVLMDVKGPGVINRIWYTMFADQNQTIKIYFDGEATPRVNRTLSDLFDGTHAPFLSPLVAASTTSSGGYTSYLPMPFAQSAKVVLVTPPENEAPSFYYQITYDTFATSTGVTTFNPDNVNSSAARTLWGNVTADPKSTTGNISLTDTIDVAADTSATLADISGVGSINSIKFKPSAGSDQTKIRIKMYWDGEVTPSVNAHFSDFFSNGFSGVYEAGVSMRALPIGIDSSGNYYCYFPMPYNRSARIVVENEDDSTLADFYYEIQYNTTPYVGLGDTAGYFKAYYHSESSMPTDGADYVILNLSGSKGHLVGVSLAGSSTYDGGSFEGDEHIYVDGSLTPQFQGTGTEDFFNGGWYFYHGPYSLPVSGNLVKSHNEDTSILSMSMYRFLLSDAIPFNDSIIFGIQHAGGNSGNPDEIISDYSSVAYYYALPKSGMELSDTFDVGNAADETAHGYEIVNPTTPLPNTFSYESSDSGLVDSSNIFDSGRGFLTSPEPEVVGSSQFVIDINPDNLGVKLRKRIDYVTPNQTVLVSVDGVPVGTWLVAGWISGDSNYRWRDADFEIPQQYTVGKSSITVKSDFISSINPYDDPTASQDANEFHYWAYSYLPIDKTAPTGEAISSVNPDSTTQLTVTAAVPTDSVSGLAYAPYWFTETSGNPGGSSSTDWQNSPVFVDSGLSPNTQYTYEVKVRDGAGNESEYSTAVSGTTSEIPVVTTPRSSSGSVRRTISLPLRPADSAGQAPIPVSPSSPLIPSPYTPTSVFTTPLYFGLTNPNVKLLQLFLNNHGFTIATTGAGAPGHETNYFGKLTKLALAKFQLQNKLISSLNDPVAGYLGPKTRALINKGL